MKRGKALVIIAVAWLVLVFASYFGIEWAADRYQGIGIELRGWEARAFVFFGSIFAIGWLPLLAIGLFRLIRERRAKSVTETTPGI